MNCNNDITPCKMNNIGWVYQDLLKVSVYKHQFPLFLSLHKMNTSADSTFVSALAV